MLAQGNLLDQICLGLVAVGCQGVEVGIQLRAHNLPSFLLA